MPRCTARSKRSKERCRKDAVTGGSVCHIHGGKSPVGAASGTYRTGRYSTALPERLLSRYGASLEDTRLTDLSDELSLVDARLYELLGRVDHGESGALWDGLRKAWGRYQNAPNPVEAALHLATVGRWIEDGWEDRANWQEVAALVEQRRKVVDTERRRLADASQMVTAAEALSLIRTVVSLVREHVTDPSALAAIHGGLSGLLDRPAAQA